MDSKTYLAIFRENGLIRSELVLIVEEQIKIFSKHGFTELAEETKWLAIEVAEIEKQEKILLKRYG
ncbi:hypothetical protein IGI37_000070 [Enterococcus sp. AZ194]|uniref:hypothetical protein n=1 Tax=Enterococcus sp. AZ194 TaxID=2774629 RepID=UPI003F298F09